MTNEIHAFPDSNVFLHYKPLSQIDWCRVLKARKVTLVICLPVIQELDNKKSDPRLADRARRAIKEIEEYEAAVKPLRTDVKLEIYNEELRRDEFPSSLNPDSQDDRIVHLARKYKLDHAEKTVYVVTEDLGMKVRCRAGGITVAALDEADRLENPGEEKDKKLKQALNELVILKNRLPKLIVSVHKPGRDYEAAGPFAVTLTDDWIDLDVEAEVEKQRTAHPKHADRKPPPLGISAIDMLGSFIKPEQWERYDREVDSYLFNYEVFARLRNTWGSNLARAIRFQILVQNTGNSPATDIDFFMALPKKIAWIEHIKGFDSASLQEPRAPNPPQRPNPEFISVSSHLSSYSGIIGPDLAGLRNMRPAPDPDEPEVKVHLRPEHGHLIHAKLSRLKHGQGIVLGTFLAVFGCWEDVSPFEVDYALSTSELPEKVDGKIPMIVTKAKDISE